MRNRMLIASVTALFLVSVLSVSQIAAKNKTDGVSIVNPAILTLPSAFGKSSPADASTQPTNPGLSWATSSGATDYEYCIDTVNNNACDASWVSTGIFPSISMAGLSNNTTYYWQVRTINAGGTTYADSGIWWSFTTCIPTPTPTRTSTKTSTISPTPTSTTTTTSTISPTPTSTTTTTSTESPTLTPTITPTATESPTIAVSQTPTITPTPVTPTITKTNTGTLTRTTSPSSTKTATLAPSSTGTATATSTTTLTVPGAFNKTAPANGANLPTTSPTLSWGASSGATNYQYCIDTVNNNACDTSWISTGSSTSIGLSGLINTTTYYWQVRAVNAGGSTYANSGAWWSFTAKKQTFNDVPVDYWAWSYIERLYSAGITGGCGTGPLIFCPDTSVTRAEMAIFVERGMRGASYTPPAGTGTVFADVPLSYYAVSWIEKLYADAITGGCASSPLRYCPDTAVTRDGMAIFLLRAKHGSSYTPPAATGIFVDVPVSYWDASWIEELYHEGIAGECSTSPLNYCPGTAVTRAQMAVYLVKTFSLP